MEWCSEAVRPIRRRSPSSPPCFGLRSRLVATLWVDKSKGRVGSTARVTSEINAALFRVAVLDLGFSLFAIFILVQINTSLLSVVLHE